MTTVSNTKEIRSINIEKVLTSYKVTCMKGNQVIVKRFDSEEFANLLSSTFNALIN